jgi:ATP-dependent DNA ligase
MACLIETLPQEVQQKAKKVDQPSWVKPMLAKLTHDYFSDEQWIFERKLDGERVLAFVDGSGRARLMSRNRKQIDDSYPEIQEALEAWAAKGCILDGEVVAFNRRNISDFNKLQQRMHGSSREQSRKSGIRVYYYLFDCLYREGHDITDCPLRSRKKILKSSVAWKDPLRWTQHRNDDGLDWTTTARHAGKVGRGSSPNMPARLTLTAARTTGSSSSASRSRSLSSPALPNRKGRASASGHCCSAFTARAISSMPERWVPASKKKRSGRLESN